MSIRILVAEHKAIRSSRLCAMLERLRYEVEDFDDAEAAWKRLAEDDAPRFAIWDWSLPGIDGPEACRRLDELPARRRPLFLLLAHRRRKEDLIAALEAGADDLITKPVDSTDVEVRLLVARRVLSLREHLSSAREALSDQSMRDPLTRLWNRSAILHFLERELSHSKRKDESLTLVVLEIEALAEVAERHGYPAGDAILQELAGRLRTAVRTSDWLGRYGDSRFALVLPGCGRERAMATAERIRQTLRARPVELASFSFRVRVHLGLASRFDPADTSDSLIRQAEQALRLSRQAESAPALATG